MAAAAWGAISPRASLTTLNPAKGASAAVTTATVSFAPSARLLPLPHRRQGTHVAYGSNNIAVKLGWFGQRGVSPTQLDAIGAGAELVGMMIIALRPRNV